MGEAVCSPLQGMAAVVRQEGGLVGQEGGLIG